MVDPWEKDEYKNARKWAKKAQEKQLDVVPCIAAWMDVCGFGSALESSSWNLATLQKNDMLTMLSEVYERVAHPFLIAVEPMPYEIVLVINDGIARTVDLGKPEFADAGQFIFYLRDLFFAHSRLLVLTRSYGYGIRTVLAGGDRVQYSPESFTGNSVLHHSKENISEYGRQLLEKNFVYNPLEFQLNTAFAKAYSLDALGSKHGFCVGGLYIESSFWDVIKAIPRLRIDKGKSSVVIFYNDLPALELYYTEQVSCEFKGLNLTSDRVTSMRVDENFEGEETYCELGKF